MIRFAKETEGLYYNEWYGHVTPRVAYEIQHKKLSPLDFNLLINKHGGLKRLDTYLRDND